MASSDDKTTSDAKRASTRSFPGYLADRALGRADFSKAPSRNESPAMPVGPIGSNNPANAAALEEARADGGQIGPGPAPKKPNPPFTPFGTKPGAKPL